MAGDWLKIEKITPDKPEIEAIATILDLDPDAVFGKCFRVWRWFDDHTTDGNAPSVTRTSIDRRIGVTGFASAMESVGWLASSPDGLMLPRFDRHSGETSKARALTAKRVAKHKSQGNAKGNDEVTLGALPREEKNREEKKEEKEFSFSTDENRTEGDRLTFPVGPSPESTRFFDAYPKKTKRNLVPDAFVRAVDAVAATHGWSDGPAAEWLIAKAQVFAKSPMGSQKDKEKIPNPAAWLDEGRYDDGPGEWELAKPPDKYHQKPKIRPLSEEQKELQNWNIP
jgi:hypothetical protein